MLFVLSTILARYFVLTHLVQFLILALVLIILFVGWRAWVAGPSTPVVPGILKGRTVILFASSLSSLSLQLVEKLSCTGAQVLIVLPTSVSDPTNIQLVFLLRQLNPNIFLEQCDLRSPLGCLRFTQKWITTTTSIPSTTGTGTAPTKLHAVIFLYDLFDSDPDVRQKISISSPLILIQTLLPYLLKSENPNYRQHPVRIIPTISPFHALAPRQAQNDGWMDREAREARMARTVWKTFESSRANSTSASSPLAPLSILPVCPGYTRLDLSRAMSPFSRRWWATASMVLIGPLVWIFGRNAREAVQGILWVLLAPIDSLGPGEVHQDRRKMKMEEPMVDRAVLEKEIEKNEVLIRNHMKVRPA